MDFEPQFKQAILGGDVAALRQLFTDNPEWKSRIDQPLFRFDSPAIVVAAADANRPLIDALLELGADINARSHWWAGSFGVLDNDNHDLAPYLVQKGANVDAHAAARHGMIEKLRQLLAANPELAHARGGDGQTPLHVASSVEIAEFLLDHGAEIDALDVDHESTPAQYLVRSRPDVTQYLIARGCKTDILMAAATGDTDLVRRHLVKDPESIRTRVDAEYFPMQNPRAGGTIYIWTLGERRSPHQLARSFGHSEVLELLLERTPDDLKLQQACLTGNSAAVSSMLARDPGSVRALAQSHPNYVSDAAENNDTEAVVLMLEAGWPAEGDRKHTPLHWACWHGNAEMVRAILPFHPPLETLDSDYHATPLGWAIHGSEHSPRAQMGDYAGAVEAMLTGGAKKPEMIAGSEAVRTILRR